VPDDASVYKLNEEQAVVLTVDFFAPLVDDPYDYGAIAAANAMSDVYAMGGEVLLALNVAAFPEDMSPHVIGDILRGGTEKVVEAGGLIAGGHTIIDREPKYGLCVMGLVHPQQVITKAAAQVGDYLLLTKPLGTGLITTAAKGDRAKTAHFQAAVESMKRLNRHPSHIMREMGAQAATDVTGFGLLGHAYEMAAAGGVACRIAASRVPILEGALEYAAQGITTGGEDRNRAYFGDKVHLQDGLSEEMKRILFDPQTSGGLLFAAAPEQTIGAARLFSESGLGLWQIGEVVAGQGVEVVA
jgi:selenide,water dikinase